jgi:hypothetical protein
MFLKKNYVRWVCILISCLHIFLPAPIFSYVRLEFPSSFNPVGSGARAMGMAGAFIAVCDDATASSWNPGGFIQLRNPELSVVYSGLIREESNHFGRYPEASHSSSVFDNNLNFFSLVYPFKMINKNMSIAFTWQHLFDFNRKWTFKITDTDWFDTHHWFYHQTGRLSAAGFSYCIEIVPRLSFGITLNLWKNIHKSNQWQQNYQEICSDRNGQVLFVGNSQENYEFNGINFNLGLLWRINAYLSTGFVYKTPFNADIGYSRYERWINQKNPLNPSGHSIEIRNDHMQMPFTSGFGIRYQISDIFLIATDISHTNWKNFSYEIENSETICPLDGKTILESKAKNTTQIRFGVEYLHINNRGYVIPFRAGLFYDPGPAVHSHDNFYGASIGSGVSFLSKERFSYRA